MTAQIIQFPDRPAGLTVWRERGADVVTLPVVRVERDDGIRGRRRRAYFAMKAALTGLPPLPAPKKPELDLARHFGVWPGDVHVVESDAATGLSYGLLYMGMDLGDPGGDRTGKFFAG